MADRFVVLPLASVMGTSHGDFEAAEAEAGKKVEQDRRPHVIVRIVGEVRPRLVPNVEVVRFDQEVANG